MSQPTQGWETLSTAEKAKVFESEKVANRVRMIEGNFRAIGSNLTAMGLPDETLLKFRGYFEEVLAEVHRAHDEAVKRL